MNYALELALSFMNVSTPKKENSTITNQPNPAAFSITKQSYLNSPQEDAEVKGAQKCTQTSQVVGNTSRSKKKYLKIASNHDEHFIKCVSAARTQCNGLSESRMSDKNKYVPYIQGQQTKELKKHQSNIIISSKLVNTQVESKQRNSLFNERRSSSTLQSYKKHPHLNTHLSISKPSSQNITFAYTNTPINLKNILPQQVLRQQPKLCIRNPPINRQQQNTFTTNQQKRYVTPVKKQINSPNASRGNSIIVIPPSPIKGVYYALPCSKNEKQCYKKIVETVPFQNVRKSSLKSVSEMPQNSSVTLRSSLSIKQDVDNRPQSSVNSVISVSLKQSSSQKYNSKKSTVNKRQQIQSQLLQQINRNNEIKRSLQSQIEDKMGYLSQRINLLKNPPVQLVSAKYCESMNSSNVMTEIKNQQQSKNQKQGRYQKKGRLADRYDEIIDKQNSKQRGFGNPTRVKVINTIF